MPSSANAEICRRIAQVRLEMDGPRGKSSFAKRIGLSASTYDYYERSRVPPADVLVRIADVACVDLRWLLTGEAGVSSAAVADHPAVQRACKLLADHPGAAAPLAAFLDILSASLAFPDKQASSTEQQAPETGGSPSPQEQAAPGPEEEWIPILGRSAAGVAQFWSDQDDQAGVTTLADLVGRHVRRSARRVRPARAGGEAGLLSGTVALITLTEPSDGDVTEFVSAGRLRSRCDDAFAVRIDGDSMAPDIMHGDVVILSPSCPAAQGRPAVAQLEGQIGVTCKLYRRSGDVVHLVSINERFPPQSFPVRKVVWALRVLARIRPNK